MVGSGCANAAAAWIILQPHTIFTVVYVTESRSCRHGGPSPIDLHIYIMSQLISFTDCTGHRGQRMAGLGIAGMPKKHDRVETQNVFYLTLLRFDVAY